MFAILSYQGYEACSKFVFKEILLLPTSRDKLLARHNDQAIDEYMKIVSVKTMQKKQVRE